MKRILFTVLGCLFILSTSIGQSEIITEFKEDHEAKSFFAYQSMIRLLNTNEVPEFNYLIKDLDHIHVALSSDNESALEAFKAVRIDIEDSGYDLLASVKNQTVNYQMYELSSKRKNTSWMAIFQFENRVGIMEMVGNLDLKYLNAFDEMDFSLLEEMMENQGLIID